MKSLLESFIDVTSGLILAIIIQLTIFPYFFNLHPNIIESLHIALIFTIVSILRSWGWRLFFKKKRNL
jgi:hypothetical protein